MRSIILVTKRSTLFFWFELVKKQTNKQKWQLIVGRYSSGFETYIFFFGFRKHLQIKSCLENQLQLRWNSSHSHWRESPELQSARSHLTPPQGHLCSVALWKQLQKIDNNFSGFMVPRRSGLQPLSPRLLARLGKPQFLGWEGFCCWCFCCCFVLVFFSGQMNKSSHLAFKKSLWKSRFISRLKVWDLRLLVLKFISHWRHFQCLYMISKTVVSIISWALL